LRGENITHLGEISKTKLGTPIKIIKYNGVNNLLVECQDEHRYQAKSTYGNFKKGQFKNPYDKSVFGVGYIGEGIYKSRENPHRMTDAYNTWCNMLERCYEEKLRYKHPTYANCYVCDDWHNYQVFAKWYYSNYYHIDGERIQIDKDIIENGNKKYSPQFCILVPQKINLVFQNKSKKSNLPTGIRLTSNGYVATYNTKNLGRFKFLEDAIEAYNAEKKNHIVELANIYKNRVPMNVYEALINIKL